MAAHLSKMGAPVILLLLPFFAAAYRTVDFPCRAHFQCQSGFCNAWRKCELQKDIGGECNIPEACRSERCANGVCQVQQETGGLCLDHSDCSEGWCNTTCFPWKAKQDPCVDDFECRSGRCTANPRRCEFVIYEPATCGKDNDCYGDRCKKDRGLNQCYARKWNNEACHDNSDCLSLRCETQNCTEPVWFGEGPCDEPSDCYSLFCNKQEGKCVQTQDEAGDNPELEGNSPGVTGSEVQAAVNGGGSVDISTGTVFEADGQAPGSGAGMHIQLLLVGLGTMISYVSVYWR